MPIFAKKNSKVLVQGITGREGKMVTKHMLNYGTEVVAGVTPGKGGEEVYDIPVFDTVSEAKEEKSINIALVYVPPQAAYDAILESMRNGIRKIVVPIERIPKHDSIKLIAEAKDRDTMIIGPNSLGVINPIDRVNVGAIGGDKPERIYAPGNVGVISRSGGMTSATSWMVKREGYGVSEAFSCGGDAFIGTTPRELLEKFEEDERTECVVYFGEPGTIHEKKIAKVLKEGLFTKPLIVFIAGRFVEKMPSKTAFGHAGAMVGKEKGNPHEKIKLLREAGAIIAEEHKQVSKLVGLSKKN